MRRSMQITAARYPMCDSEDVLPIVYELPAPELVEEAHAGRLKPGGCIVGPDSPGFHCEACGHEWRVCTK
jgi:hypothetical protein